MNAHALASSAPSIAGYHRGRIYQPSAPPEGQLVQLASLLAAPSAVPARIEMELHGQALTVAIEIDGKIYRGTADLSQIFDVAKTYLEAYHAALHRRGHMLVGAAPAPAQVAGPIACDTVDRACDLLVGALVDQHRREYVALCCGWLDDIGNAVSSAAKGVAHAATSAISSAAKEVGNTLQKLKGPITTAATAAAGAAATAIPGVGPLVAPMASSLANNLINAATGSGPSQQASQKVVAQAQQAAQTNPQVAIALDTAHQAVAQATAGYHTAVTAQNAAQGDPNAAGQLGQLAQAAQSGDKGAQAAIQIAQAAYQDLVPWPDQGGGRTPPDLAAANAAALATPYDDGSGGGDGDATVQGVPSVRELASNAAQQWTGDRAVGVVQEANGNWQVQGFPDGDAADDWFGGWLNRPHAYRYVAYYDRQDPSFPGPLNEQYGSPAAVAHEPGVVHRGGPAEVSGWLGVLGGLLAGSAAGYYGPDAYRWVKGKWASHAAQAPSAATPPHP